MAKPPFNIVELIVAIVLLGVLAGAVIYTIDPVERAKADRDELYREQAKEILEAIDKYYIGSRELPWGGEWTSVSDPKAGLDLLISEGLLGFDIKKFEKIYLGKGESVDSQLFACFVPESLGGRVDYIPLKKLEPGKALPEDSLPEFCPGPPDWSNTVCYQCVSRKLSEPKK